MAKGKLNATIDSRILEEWVKYCDERFVNRSKLLEKLIKDYLQKEGGKKVK